MQDSVFDWFTPIIHQIWRLFYSWYIPGTEITPGMLFIAFATITIIVKFLHKILGNSEAWK